MPEPNKDLRKRYGCCLLPQKPQQTSTVQYLQVTPQHTSTVQYLQVVTEFCTTKKMLLKQNAKNKHDHKRWLLSESTVQYKVVIYRILTWWSNHSQDCSGPWGQSPPQAHYIWLCSNNPGCAGKHFGCKSFQSQCRVARNPAQKKRKLCLVFLTMSVKMPWLIANCENINHSLASLLFGYSCSQVFLTTLISSTN